MPGLSEVLGYYVLVRRLGGQKTSRAISRALTTPKAPPAAALPVVGAGLPGERNSDFSGLPRKPEDSGFPGFF